MNKYSPIIFILAAILFAFGFSYTITSISTRSIVKNTHELQDKISDWAKENKIPIKVFISCRGIPTNGICEISRDVTQRPITIVCRPKMCFIGKETVPVTW